MKGEDPQAWVATEFIHYTRATLTSAVSAMIATCHEFCSATFATHIPNRGKYSAKDIAAILTHTYTVTKGVNKDAVRNHMAHFQAVARNEINRNIKSDDLDFAIDKGEAWAADGVVDKNGDLVAYLTEAKAKKAHARKAHAEQVEAPKGLTANKRVTGDWYDPKSRKQAYMADAVVFSDNPEGMVSMDTLRTMPWMQVKTLALKAGCPKGLVTGAGSLKRAINWFSEDVARISLANL